MSQLFSLSLRASVLTLAIIASTVQASAGIIVPGTEQAHLDFAADPMFQSVGFLRGVNSSGSFLAGSAVLIHPEWVLTVGHALDDGWSALQFSLNSSAFDPNRTLYSADSWFTFPGFVADNGGGQSHDIGLVHLAEPIPVITPAEIFWGDVLPGTRSSWSGYGSLAYYPTGEVSVNGEKRAGENMIDSIGSPIFGIANQFMLSEFSPAYGDPSLPLEMGLTPGDSGSGWFADIEGKMSLIGLGAFGRGTFTLSGVIRPAVYRDWIQDVTGIPEPSSALLMLSMIPAFLAWNGRQRKGDKRRRQG